MRGQKIPDRTVRVFQSEEDIEMVGIGDGDKLCLATFGQGCVPGTGLTLELVAFRTAIISLNLSPSRMDGASSCRSSSSIVRALRSDAS